MHIWQSHPVIGVNTISAIFLVFGVIGKVKRRLMPFALANKADVAVLFGAVVVCLLKHKKKVAKTR